MSLGAGLLLLMWVLASVLANGIALLHRFTKLRGLELVGYGTAAGAALHGLLGCAIAAAPAGRWAVVVLLLALTVVSAVYFLARGVARELHLALSSATKTSLALWLLFQVLCLGLIHAEVRFPDFLPDGPYIFKTHTTNMKIQYLTGLPTDNYIPFTVAEYFLRGVSFENARPILPGNEVSNRTILMPLIALPFRVALGAPRDYPQLGTFHYIGRDWPDISKLNTGDAYDQFAVIGLALNSLLLVGLFVFCSSLGANSILPVAALLYLTNQYFIAQTIYTWPKAFAGFFILLAWTSMRAGHGPLTVAALMALAYHAHPYAIVFAGCAGLFYLTQWRREKSRVPSAIQYLLGFALLLAPWFIWTRFVVQIPSDLVAQNFAGAGTEAAWASPINFVWIRLQNFFYLIFSMAFTVYPFDFRLVLNYWVFSLPGVVGLVLIYPGFAQCAELPKPRPWLWYGFLGPGLLILAVYSCPAFPVLHGYQALMGMLLCFGVWWLSRQTTRMVFAALIGLQLAINLSLLLARGLITGVHF